MYFEQQADDQRDDDRVPHDGDARDRLVDELGRAAAVEEAVDAAGAEVASKEADQQVPTRPPTRWTPTTSSESSYFELVLQSDGQGAERTGDQTDERWHRPVLTAAAAGVIATRPATTPEAAPRLVA